MHRLSFSLASIIVHRRWLVIALLSIVTCISIVGHWNPQLVWSLFEAPAETEQQQETTESTRSPSSTVSPISLSYADAVLVIESEDFFNPRSVAALRKIASQLESLDQVRSVLWLDRVPVLNIFGLPEPLLPQASAFKRTLCSGAKEVFGTSTGQRAVAQQRWSSAADADHTGLLSHS